MRFMTRSSKSGGMTEVHPLPAVTNRRLPTMPKNQEAVHECGRHQRFVGTSFTAPDLKQNNAQIPIIGSARAIAQAHT
jgi:hypothetical protein